MGLGSKLKTASLLLTLLYSVTIPPFVETRQIN